ncbi:MAG: radical SAM protein [Lachnospiraceae bacterium]|nr:radical SAM protein [Lachnospiraceae bacterium]
MQTMTDVMHTTLNPEGPGVVRIHLVPPKQQEDMGNVSVAIINGQDIIPVNLSWAILLTEFIKEVNHYHGRAITEEDSKAISRAVIRNMRKIYPLLPGRIIRRDIYTILHTFTQIARGEEPDVDISYISIGDYAPYMKAPHRMDLMISAMTKGGMWNCNQQCVHCYAAGQKMAEEAELGTEEWKKIIDKCRAVGIPQVTFTGGEPTMRDDLTELIAHAAWFVTRLNTNGIRLTEEFCKKLFEASLDSVQITFYSKDAKAHNRLVGAPQYEQTVSGIKNALAAGLSVSVNTPLCKLNADYVETLKFLHEMGVIYVTCSGLIPTGNAREEASEQLQLSKEEITSIVKEAVDYCHTNGMEISFTSPGWIDAAFFEECGIPTPTCGACLSNMAITPGGNIVPCQSWLSGEPLGNMLKDSWSAVWDGDACLKRREESAKMAGICYLNPMCKEDDHEE